MFLAFFDAFSLTSWSCCCGVAYSCATKAKTPTRRLAIATAVAFFMVCLLGRTEIHRSLGGPRLGNQGRGCLTPMDAMLVLGSLELSKTTGKLLHQHRRALL